MTMQRLLPLSGVVFVALTAIAFAGLGGTTPDVDASQSTIVDFYTRHHRTQTDAAYVLMIAVGFLALFAASLWSRLAETDASGTWRVVLVVGAGVAVAGFLTAATLHFALASGVHAGVSPSAAQALNALDARDYLAFTAGVGIMLVGAAGAMIRAAGAQRILGWAALVIGVAIFTPLGFFGFLAAGLWISVTSLVLTSSDPALTPTTVVEVAT